MKINSNVRPTLLWTALLLLAVVIAMTSCRRDLGRADNDPVTPPDVSIEIPEGWFAAEVMIQSEALNTPTLRALSAAGENEVKQSKMHILVFDGEGKYHYEAKITKVEASSVPTDQKRRGKISLLARNSQVGDKSIFVVLANVETPTGSITEGMTMEEVMQLFTFKMPSDGIWQDGTLPMWGASAPVSVLGSGGPVPQIGTIHLVRAVARVDIGLNMTKTTGGESAYDETAQGIKYVSPDGIETEIKLSKVYLYNTNNGGRVAPIAEDPNIWDRVNRKAKKPSIPTPAPGTKDRMDRSGQIVAQKSLLREIYLPEAANDPATTTNTSGETVTEDVAHYLQRPFMVIGLVGADRSHPTKETFFRIDYLKRSGTGSTATYEYLSLLRNHRYLVNITKVGGAGFDTEEEAMRGPAANIMYNVELWNEASMSNIEYDGQYMLGISEGMLTYYNQAYAQSILVRTDFPQGWTATVTQGSEWLSLSATEGESGTETILEIHAGKNSSPDATERMGEVTIKAGRMTSRIKVKQLYESKLSLEIYEEDGVTPISIVDFQSHGGQKNIVVKYEPSDGAFELKKVNGDDFRIEEINDGTSTEGVRRYRITAVPMTDENDDFEVIENFAQVKVTADDGRVLRKILTVNQTEYNIIPYKDKINHQLINNLTEGDNELYLMDGNTKSFYIKSNLPYRLELIENHPDPIYGGDPKEKMIETFENRTRLGKFSGEEITFKTYNDLTKDQQKRMYGTAKFRITSIAKNDATGAPLIEREFSIDLASGIIQPEANCYLMKPGRVGILIPVSIVNTAKEIYDKNADQMRDHPGSYYLNKRDWDEKIALPRLGDTDEWTAEVVWSDMESNEQLPAPPVKPDGSAGFRIIKSVGIGSSGYIFILPGKHKTGNAVVRCREAQTTGHNTLWSWHIWMVDEYPMQQHINNPNGYNNQILDRNLGANRIATSYRDADKESYGMQYQFGRKDPFPIPKDDGYKMLVDKDGYEFKIQNQNSYITVKESIIYSTEMVNHPSNWMYEVGKSHYHDLRVWYEIWGGSMDDTSEKNGAWRMLLETQKSVFDPSPYGWKIPAMGWESNWKSRIESGELILPLCGYFVNGDITRYDDHKTYYGLSTVPSRDIAPRTISFGDNGTQPSVDLDRRFNRSGTLVIRSIFNNEESDYNQYLP